MIANYFTAGSLLRLAAVFSVTAFVTWVIGTFVLRQQQNWVVPLSAGAVVAAVDYFYSKKRRKASPMS